MNEVTIEHSNHILLYSQFGCLALLLRLKRGVIDNGLKKISQIREMPVD